MRSHQYSLGGYYTGIEGWEFSVEGYYKDMYNVLEYKEGVKTSSVLLPVGKIKWKWARDVRQVLSLWHRRHMEKRRDGCPTLYQK